MRAGLVFILAACAVQAHGEAPKSLTELDRKAVAKLLRVEIRVGQIGMQVSDEFLKDGRYYHNGDRVRIGGAYALNGNRICTKTRYAAFNTCRTVLTDKDGQMYMSHAGGTPYPVQIVEIRPDRNWSPPASH